MAETAAEAPAQAGTQNGAKGNLIGLVSGLGLKSVWGLGFKVSGSGFGDYGRSLDFRGLEFRAYFWVAKDLRNGLHQILRLDTGQKASPCTS